MRILLLSCNTGEGHNSTAKAVMEVLEARGVTCEMRDVLACLSPKFSKFVCNWHVWLYKYGPALFDTAYRAMDRVPAEPNETTPVYELLSLGAEKLRELLEAGDYDAVICVHVFSGMMVTEVRRKWGLRVPCFFVNTDYSCVPFTEQCEMDGYFIPDTRLIPEFAADGVPKARMIPSGIPVRQAFFSHKERAVARQELELPEDGFVVLLMCGSMGCGPMRKLAREMADRIPDGGMVVTVCGRNEKLYESMMDIQDPRLRVLGFTTNIPDYMDAADLVVTKPGGLSSTEAACKHLPMVFINAVGGCEAKNFEMFLREGYAVGSKNVEDVLELVTDLSFSPQRLEQMRRLLERDFTKNPAQIISDIVLAAGKKYREDGANSQ